MKAHGLATFQLQRQEDGSLFVSVLECAGVKTEIAGSGAPPRLLALHALRLALAPPPSPVVPLEAYHEDLGPVLWWRFPVDEAPFVGAPNDSDWPGYHTHFTMLPAVPERPTPVVPDLGFVERCDGGPGSTSIKKSHRGEGLNFVD